MRRSTFACALVALSLAGCAASFDSGSKLKSLRVLAVKKDKPYARPGETVHLQMLLDDPRKLLPDSGTETREKISIGWLSGCENPKGDSFLGCTSEFASADAGSLLHAGFGTLDFDVTLSKDIIPDPLKHPPSNPAEPPNGSSFVFFAVCAGTLELGGTNGFNCRSSSGKLLGADDFVAGYTQIFAYKQLRNNNPQLSRGSPSEADPATGFQVNGKNVPLDCFGDACVALEREELGVGLLTNSPPELAAMDSGSPASPSASDSGLPDAGVALFDGGARDAGAVPDAGTMKDAGAPIEKAPLPSCADGDRRCFPVCTEDDQNNCPKLSVSLDVDKAKSLESDGVAKAIDGRNVWEQMWINYYTDAGKLEHDVKLLSDATTGWNDAHAADLRVPQTLGTFHVWAVAHDNRGGVEWARVTLATQSQN
ncbi:MAG TPA: hypothetical protein VHC69_23075 [Polyangiaceae bacterium]|nr:hypothetical protein [Polyangiaceae bacterium]